MNRQKAKHVSMAALLIVASAGCGVRKESDSPSEPPPPRPTLSVAEVRPLLAPPAGATILRPATVVPGRTRLTAQYCIPGEPAHLGEKLATHFRAAGWQAPEHTTPSPQRVLTLTRDGKRLFLTWPPNQLACRDGETFVAVNLDPSPDGPAAAAPREAELRQLLPAPDDARVVIAPQLITITETVNGSYCLHAASSDGVQSVLEKHFVSLGWTKVDTLSVQPSTLEAHRDNVYVGVRWRHEPSGTCTGEDATTVFYSVRIHEPPRPAAQAARPGARG